MQRNKKQHHPSTKSPCQGDAAACDPQADRIAIFSSYVQYTPKGIPWQIGFRKVIENELVIKSQRSKGEESLSCTVETLCLYP